MCFDNFSSSHKSVKIVIHETDNGLSVHSITYTNRPGIMYGVKIHVKDYRNTKSQQHRRFRRNKTPVGGSLLPKCAKTDTSTKTQVGGILTATQGKTRSSRSLPEIVKNLINVHRNEDSQLHRRFRRDDNTVSGPLSPKGSKPDETSKTQVGGDGFTASQGKVRNSRSLPEIVLAVSRSKSEDSTSKRQRRSLAGGDNKSIVGLFTDFIVSVKKAKLMDLDLV